MPNDVTPCDVKLRDVSAADLPSFFEHQRDPTAVRMAAFTTVDPEGREAFDVHWARILGDESVTIRTITLDGRVAGHVLVYGQAGEREVSYWVGREFWGHGVATTALTLFLRRVGERPLFARVAKDNLASIRVLEKCGFMISGEDTAFANARGEEIEEIVFTLR